ncbi:hypothetical protein [Robiginitalea biformata]|uniref:Uncharacterized protein n=1 Tax=Robiginitalea biformata (strain ATCC BAA-864 / DSM 15991 / KCTC 12146 / HTCC2501) TaxID=313596 RepID=A4CP50_ROBBH|nr:hypothetical protein [Robiginitalea biformata]EAR14667.1 hypothetical protein RB2501_01286 [Robiginitalea biformata HTCC2501]
MRIFFILLFTCLTASGQSKMLLASLQQGAPTAIFDGQNAADPVNEVNGTANTGNAGGDVTVTSETSPTPTNGTYYLLFNKNTASGLGTENASITLVGVLTGDDITVSIDYNEIVGNAFTIALPSGLGWDVTDNFNTSSGGWITDTSLRATATVDNPELRVALLSAANLNDQIGIDNIVLTKNN